jgi:sugar/nucleoside kinase (ribokinase family)
VISPNILELQSLLSIEANDHASGEDVEHAARAFYALIQSSHIIQDQVPAIIVRAGPLGSYTFSSEWSGWVPPFFTASEQERVVDPTGGGNGFLGGLCAGLLVSQGDIRAGECHCA